MFAKVTADYSKFPAEIRDVLPILEGEVSELRTYWEVYRFLFMEKEEKTKFLAERFGAMLGLMQNLLESQMILSISCLTDKDFKGQRNVSLRALTEAIPAAKEKDFRAKVNSALDKISSTVADVRLHRHKHIAHFDLNVALGQHAMPIIFLNQFKSALEQMESFLNLFHWEFERVEVGFDGLSCGDFTEQAFTTACKSKVFDELEAEGIIRLGELERRIDKWPWWSWH